MKNKKADMFQLIFGIIAGAVVLFIALYVTFRFIGTERHKIETELGKELDILLNPLETSILEAQSIKSSIFPYDLVTELSCNYDGIGNENIKIKILDRFGGKKEAGSAIGISNKYIFAQSSEQGKQFNIFTKKLKIFGLDMIYVSLSQYCFVKPPEFIKSEIEMLNLSNVEIKSSSQQCRKDSRIVKFDIDCYYDCENNAVGYVIKDNEKIKVRGSAMIYAAIFSSSDIYYCNMKRIAYRLSLLAELNLKKAELLKKKGCNFETIENELENFKNRALQEAGKDKPDLISLSEIFDNLETTNSYLQCRLW
jgi:hypothetical protein